MRIISDVLYVVVDDVLVIAGINIVVDMFGIQLMFWKTNVSGGIKSVGTYMYDIKFLDLYNTYIEFNYISKYSICDYVGAFGYSNTELNHLEQKNKNIISE